MYKWHFSRENSVSGCWKLKNSPFIGNALPGIGTSLLPQKEKPGSGPEGCDEKGRRPCDAGEASSLCTLGKKQSGDVSPTPPCRRPILIAIKYLLFRGQAGTHFL